MDDTRSTGCWKSNGGPRAPMDDSNGNDTCGQDEQSLMDEGRMGCWMDDKRRSRRSGKDNEGDSNWMDDKRRSKGGQGRITRGIVIGMDDKGRSKGGQGRMTIGTVLGVDNL